MEGNSNWNLNEQSALRNNSVSIFVIWLRNLFPYDGINQIEEKARRIEQKIYGIAIDKDDYNRKISERILMMKREAEDFHSGSSVNQTNYTLEPAAQVLNQGRQELLPQQQQLANQQLEMPISHETNETNDVRMRQGNNIEAGLFPTPLASPAQLLDQQILGGSPFAIPSPVLEDLERIPGTFQSSEGSRACLPEDLTETLKRSLTTHDEEQNQSKRIKSLITSQTDLESEGDSTVSSGSKVNKTNGGI